MGALSSHNRLPLLLVTISLLLTTNSAAAQDTKPRSRKKPATASAKTAPQAPPAIPSPVPRGVRPTPDFSATTADAAKEGPPPIHVEIGLGVYRRRFSFTDAAANLDSFEIEPAIALSLRGEWFPATQFHLGGAARYIGFGVSYEAPFAIKSEGFDSKLFPASAFAWQASILGRVAAGGWHFMGEIGFGERAFRIDSNTDSEPPPQIPDVRYKQITVAARLRTPSVGPLSLAVRGGLNASIEAGEVDDAAWYPDSTTRGWVGEAALEYALGDTVAAYACASAVIQNIDLNPGSGDTRGASKATDEYVTGTIGLRYSGFGR